MSQITLSPQDCKIILASWKPHKFSLILFVLIPLYFLSLEDLLLLYYCLLIVPTCFA